MKSECPSVHKPASWSGTFDPALEVQCSLKAGHRGLHRGAGFSWPDENCLNPNRALNPAELRYTMDMISTVFGFIGLLLLIVGLVLIWFYGFPGFLVCVVGLGFLFGGYTVWKRSLRI